MDKISGVYKITNLINNKIYIGSAMDFEGRKYRHLNSLKKNKHHSIKLQRAYNKYGEESFKFEILEKVYFNEVHEKLFKIQYLQSLEQYYLNKYKPYITGYNVSSKSDSGSYVKTEETFIKARNTRIINGTVNMTQEAKDNISFGLRNSEKAKKAREVLHNKLRIKIYQYDLDGNFIKEWNSIKEASENLNIKQDGIKSAIKHSNRTFSGFMFKNYKKKSIDKFKFVCKKIIMIDTFLNEETIFESYKNCADFLSAKHITISSIASRSGTYQKRYKIKYYNL